MPISTVHTRSGHVVHVWALLPGDVAHPDGYADVTIDTRPTHATLPLETITEV